MSTALFPYAQLVQKYNLLFYPDIHVDPSFRRELYCAIPSLKKHGLTHLALEMLPASFQPMLDQKHLSRGDWKVLQDHFEKCWNHDRKNGADLLLRIVNSARDLGIELVALDIDPAEAQAQYNIFMEVDGKITRLADIVQPKRENQWMNILATKLAGKNRLLVYCGDFYSGFTIHEPSPDFLYLKELESIPAQLRKKGYESCVIKPVGGCSELLPEEKDLRTRLRNFLASAKAEVQRFF